MIFLKWFGGMIPRMGEQHLKKERIQESGYFKSPGDVPPRPSVEKGVHATDAQNTDLYSGELRPMVQPALAHTFVPPGPDDFTGGPGTPPPPPPPPGCIPVEITAGLVAPGSVIVGNILVLSIEVNADATAPVQVQWYQDGGLIPGAVALTHAFLVTESDVSTRFQVAVQNPCGEDLSEEIIIPEPPSEPKCIQWGTGGVDQIDMVEVWRPSTRYMNKQGFANKIEHHGVMAVHDDDIYIVEHPVSGDWGNAALHVSYDGGTTFALGNPPADRQYGDLFELPNGVNPSWPDQISIDSIQFNQQGELYVCATPTQDPYTSDPYWAKASVDITGVADKYQWETVGSNCMRNNVGRFHGYYEKGRSNSHSFGFDNNGTILFTMRQGGTTTSSYRALNFGKTVLEDGTSPPTSNYKTPIHLHQDGNSYRPYNVWTIGDAYFYAGNSGTIRRFTLNDHFNLSTVDYHRSEVNWNGSLWLWSYTGTWHEYGGTANTPQWGPLGETSIERTIRTGNNIIWMHKKIVSNGYGIRMSYPYPPNATAYMYQIAGIDDGTQYTATIELYSIAKTILSETRDALFDFTVVESNQSVVCTYVYGINQYFIDHKVPHIYIRKLHNADPAIGNIGSDDADWSDVIRVNFPAGMGIICNHGAENSFVKLDYSEKNKKFYVCCLVEYDDGVKGQWVGTFDDPFVCELYG